MLSKEKMAMINALAAKKKREGLTEHEQNVQKMLYDEYLTAFRGGFKKTVEGMKVVDKEGTDVTPEKLKQIQKEKGLHGRGDE
ncbi:MAG: DUF896 domain-containing protein [Lactobacillales bacterium]|jgi:uncharacterized protein YnzC (UPF0291/DUF896 family)|nr:DUF896 domain-containing protein [Lactobacillales bacterium]